MKSNDETSTFEARRVEEPLDDSRLVAFAAQRGFEWAWRTMPEGGAWRAEVGLGERTIYDRLVTWVVKQPTQQAALELGITFAIGFYEKTASASAGSGAVTRSAARPSG